MRKLFFLFINIVIATSAKAEMIGKASGSVTERTQFYTDDINADKTLNHKFGVFETVNGYEDPDFSDALKYPSPLLDGRYVSYDIIIVSVLNNEKINTTTVVAEKGQRMRVYVRPTVMDQLGWERFHINNPYDPDIGLLYHWKISSANDKKITPRGHFPVDQFSSNHVSSSYGSPMPWSVFFRLDLYAFHGTSSTSQLGTNVSKGCIRVETQRARELFHLIGQNGQGTVDVVNRDGSISRDASGNPNVRYGYRTLIIVK